MGRSRGFVQTLIQIERAAQRDRAARERAATRALRERERARRAGERYRLASEKEQKRIHVDSRLAEVEEQNADLEKSVEALRTLLASGLGKSTALDLDTLKETLRDEPFEPGVLAQAAPPPLLATYLPPAPGLLQRMLPGAQAKHELRTQEARQRYDADMAAHAQAEQKRQQNLQAAQAAHMAKVEENRRRVAQQHEEIEGLKRGLQARTAEEVAAYFTLALDRSEYPEGFPCSSDLTYEPNERHLVVDLDLPCFDVVPAVGAFKYVKSKDEIAESPRSAKERRELYASVLAQTTLRTLHEIFSADKPWQAVDTVVLNGYVDGIDPATGQTARPCVVSLQASPDVFATIDLRRVDPAACLRALHAEVSKSPEQMVPVEPSFDLNLAPRALKKTKK